jgi:outer membrane receptor for ferrienterochelin and colicins
MAYRSLLVATAAAAALLATRAAAANADAANPQVSEIVVTAQRLDAARSTVEPALGATTYSMPEAFIGNLPAGANIQINQVILQKACRCSARLCRRDSPRTST